MICARPGCANTTGHERNGTPRRYCSNRCYVLRARPILRVIVPEAVDYEMTCLHCGTRYDGRTGPWVGLCSLACVGAHAMGEIAGRRIVNGGLA